MAYQKSLIPLFGFLAAFYVVDVARLFLEHSYSIHIDRLFTWVMPTMLFIFFCEKKNPITYLKLKDNFVKGILVGLLAGGIQGIIHVGFNYFYKGEVIFDTQLGYQTWWDVIITVGIVEEIVFRGLVLQKIWSVTNFWMANFMSSFLFMIAHIPYWAFGGQFSMPASTIIWNFGFVVVMGLLEGYLLKRTNSLWACIVHHSINNFLSMVVR